MASRVLTVLKNHDWLFVGILTLGIVLLTTLHSFLLFHSLVELFSVFIAFGIFIVAWNCRQYLDNNYLLFLGVAYFFVGVIDLLHTLAYKGMGVFQGYDANLPTQLWIVARYTESLSLLLAPFFFHRNLKVSRVFALYSVAIAILLGSVFYGPIFPDCFVEGKGLTSFKKVSEYIISLILLGSMALLLHKRHEFERPVLLWIVWSIIATIISELAFTFYVSVYGLSNLVGHVFKLASFYLIYKAIIETGLRRPYGLMWRNLKLSEERLREERDRVQSYLDVAGVIFLVIGADQKVQLINRKGCEILGWPENEIVGKNWFDHFLPEEDREKVKAVFSELVSAENDGRTYFENFVLTKGGEKRLIAWRNTVLRDGAGKITATLSSGVDITEQKQAEAERERLIEELQKALSKVRLLSGMLPICASCKKVRDDKGYWTQIEAYIRDHSEVEFTHGLCPECVKKLYPDENLDEP